MFIYWNEELRSKLLNRRAIKLSAATIAVSVLVQSSSSMSSNSKLLDAPGNLQSLLTQKKKKKKKKVWVGSKIWGSWGDIKFSKRDNSLPKR